MNNRTQISIITHMMANHPSFQIEIKVLTLSEIFDASKEDKPEPHTHF